MDVYLVRHTDIDIEPGICYGQSDIDVADSFSEDAKEVREKLSGVIEESIFFSSPLKRCRKLAEALSSQEIRFDPRLQELNFGDWELQRWDNISRNALEKWSSDMSEACPGGESYWELNQRVVEWWQELMEMEEESVIVVTHAGVIQSIISHVLEFPYANSSRVIIDWRHVSAVSVKSDNYLVNFVNR